MSSANSYLVYRLGRRIFKSEGIFTHKSFEHLIILITEENDQRWLYIHTANWNEAYSCSYFMHQTFQILLLHTVRRSVRLDQLLYLRSALLAQIFFPCKSGPVTQQRWPVLKSFPWHPCLHLATFQNWNFSKVIALSADRSVGSLFFGDVW